MKVQIPATIESADYFPAMGRGHGSRASALPFNRPAASLDRRRHVACVTCKGHGLEHTPGQLPNYIAFLAEREFGEEIRRERK